MLRTLFFHLLYERSFPHPPHSMTCHALMNALYSDLTSLPSTTDAKRDILITWIRSDGRELPEPSLWPTRSEPVSIMASTPTVDCHSRLWESTIGVLVNAMN